MLKNPKCFKVFLWLQINHHKTQVVEIASYGDFSSAYNVFYPIVAGEQTLTLPPDAVLPTGPVNATLVLGEVFPDGGVIPLSFYDRTLQAADIRGKIRWLEPVYRELPSEVVFRPDFGTVCVIDEDGAMGDALGFFLEYLPWDIELCVLATEIDQWQRLYERGVDIDRKKNIDFDWEGFHAKGMVLFKKLQQHLGHRTKIVYLKVTELEPPDYEGCEIRFSPD